MKLKNKIKKEIHKNDEKNKDTSTSKNNLKLQIDTKFWRKIDQNYFNKNTNQMTFEVNKTLNLLSHHSNYDYINTPIPIRSKRRLHLF